MNIVATFRRDGAKRHERHPARRRVRHRHQDLTEIPTGGGVALFMGDNVRLNVDSLQKPFGMDELRKAVRAASRFVRSVKIERMFARCHQMRRMMR